MAYDQGLAEIMRTDLDGHGQVVEKKMFGGLCFMLDGHMVCGVHRGGGMYRVGKQNHATALDIPGASEMAFTGRPMGGLVDVTADAIADDGTRAALLSLALDFVKSLPPK